MTVDFTSERHPVLCVACPDCGQRAGSWCIRPSGHKAHDFHRARKEAADALFIDQHGAGASIERTEGDGWKIDPTGYRTELTPEGEQLVIPGCERKATKENPQGSLF